MRINRKKHSLTPYVGLSLLVLSTAAAVAIVNNNPPVKPAEKLKGNDD